MTLSCSRRMEGEERLRQPIPWQDAGLGAERSTEERAALAAAHREHAPAAFPTLRAPTQLMHEMRACLSPGPGSHSPARRRQ